MEPASENKIILVTRRTRLDELIGRFNTIGQARFYVEHLGADFGDYEREHATYQEALHEAQQTLSRLGRLQSLDRDFLPNYVFGPTDTIVALGQDGLVANTVKYLAGQPLLGVNPDPGRWDGQLLPFRVGDLAQALPEVFAGQRRRIAVSMARADLNTGQRLYAVNDFFIGMKSHASARYRIVLGPREEQQSSSGVIVSTGVGSTGWLKSLVAGATSVAHEVTGTGEVRAEHSFAWDADYLYFTVREPFPSRVSSASIVFGKVTPESPLQLQSQMAENGVIFSDGIEKDYVEFNSGTRAIITVAEKKGNLVV